MRRKDPRLVVAVCGLAGTGETTEFGLASSMQRVTAAAAMIVGFGADPEQVTTVAYGTDLLPHSLTFGGGVEIAFLRMRT